ncbi:MAG: hypothetical protein NZ742_03390 [Acidobacteria bacterium]|nr:hypothetical protein [Acidobacteriota bacterium]MDW7983468.1 hypothetical protein [Acidobacteriota bacterium]
MDLQVHLDQVLADLPACESVWLMGMDGLAVARAVRDPRTSDEMESFAAEYTSVIQALHRAFQRMAADTYLFEHIHTTGRCYLLARFVTPSYYVLMRLRSDGLLGQARYRLQRLCQRLAAELEAF